jgi:hypothetical protein
MASFLKHKAHNFHKNRGGMASVTEVVIASIIFAIAAAGILATVSFLKPQSTTSAKRLEAAYIGKSILEELRQNVDLDAWDTAGGDLDPAVAHSITIGDYTVDWTVTDVFGDNTLRKVDMTITY